MPERQSAHPDNDLIDRAGEFDTPGQQSSSGGEVNRRVGSRAEEKNALEGEPEIERAVGSDNPDEDAQKGDKTIGAMPTSPD